MFSRNSLTENGKEYLAILDANNKGNIMLYGMPVLESDDIIYKETKVSWKHC